MTLAEIQKREKALVASLSKAFGKVLRELRAELLSNQSELRYLGIFDRERGYKLGNFVTHSGSMWHANRATNGEVPGDGSDAWTLCVKGR